MAVRLDEYGCEMPRSGWIVTHELGNQLMIRMARYGLEDEAEELLDEIHDLVEDRIRAKGLPEYLVEGEDAD